MKILNHRLTEDNGDPIPFIQTPNVSTAVIAPEFLVMHFTAGRSAQSSIEWLTNPRAQASAHLVIGRDGGITQLAAFNRRAWHAGVSRWDGRDDVNSFAIGIELDNQGRLTKDASGKWKAWFGGAVDESEVLVAKHRDESEPAGWQTYTEPQLSAAAGVAALIVSKYGLKDVIGHEDIAPHRKVDPGPAFQMASFRSKVMGREQGVARLLSTTAVLNIRSGPGTEFAPVPGSPLSKGTAVEVLQTQGLWFRVDASASAAGVASDIVGWVHSGFLSGAG